jgi:hypothetical protein
MYQAASAPQAAASGTVAVVLTFEVPAGFVELPLRTAQLADEYGRIIARSVPGVRVRPAQIGAAPPTVTGPVPQRGLVIGRNDAWIDRLPLRLTRREFALLRHLAERQGEPASRGELMVQVWRDPRMSGRTVDTHVRRLRTKLGDYAVALRTVRGCGYRWDPADLPDLSRHNVTVTGPTVLHTETAGLSAVEQPRPLAT